MKPIIPLFKRSYSLSGPYSDMISRFIDTFEIYLPILSKSLSIDSLISKYSLPIPLLLFMFSKSLYLRSLIRYQNIHSFIIEQYPHIITNSHNWSLLLDNINTPIENIIQYIPSKIILQKWRSIIKNENIIWNLDNLTYLIHIKTKHLSNKKQRNLKIIHLLRNISILNNKILPLCKQYLANRLVSKSLFRESSLSFNLESIFSTQIQPQ